MKTTLLGTLLGQRLFWQRLGSDRLRRLPMHGIIYLVGLIVVILAIPFFGLR